MAYSTYDAGYRTPAMMHQSMSGYDDFSSSRYPYGEPMRSSMDDSYYPGGYAQVCITLCYILLQY